MTTKKRTYPAESKQEAVRLRETQRNSRKAHSDVNMVYCSRWTIF
jgi:transposase-like protein